MPIKSFGTLTALRLGVATIVGGIVLIAGGSTLFKRTSPQDGSGLARGLRWGTLTGLTIAAYTLVDGWSVKTLSVTPLVFYALGLTLRSLLMRKPKLVEPALFRRLAAG